MSKSVKARIGAVSYLNTKPLVYGLQERLPDSSVIFDLPSRLADQLAENKLDVALIPSIEYFANPDYTIISDACIGCRGCVLSVVLLSRVPMSQIRTLALDEGSRTSIALTKVLLSERFGIEPECCSFPVGANFDDVEADAYLVIGDRAVHVDTSPFEVCWDLGEQWGLWSQLPFVFAMWVARPGWTSDEVAAVLSESRNEGVADLEVIAHREANGIGLSPAECLYYLRDNLHFYLADDERKALELFRSHADRLRLIPDSGCLRAG